jgi:hypothetical protein
MVNMSYCRWENTANDLSDCLNELDEVHANDMTLTQFEKTLASYELTAFRNLLEISRNLIKIADRMADIE